MSVENKLMRKQTKTQSLVPPSLHIDISFKDINYSTSTSFFSKERKPILKNVSGLFKSGELTAIMGPSGAGKSSLLNVLSGFIKEGVEGEMFANGTLLDKKKSLIKNHSSYILQDDYLNPLFTVNEIMHHAADLKLTSSYSRKSKKLLIEDILDNMCMSETANTYCGSLSGGQKKRLNICLELINNPSVFYFDEPTSGQDSSSSTLLISELKNLAHSGRTVICTIHQPSAALFSQFDHLYLLSEGRSLYQGSPSNILRFLNCLGITCPVFHNPADFVMDVVSGEFGDFTDKFIQTSNNNSWRVNNKPNTGASFKNAKADKDDFVEHTRSEWVRFYLLVGRLTKLIHRDWMLSYLKLIVHMIVGVIIGLAFPGFGDHGGKVISNLGFLFVSLVFICYTSMLPATLKIPNEIEVIKKEHFNNWYRFTTYFLAFIFVHIPVQLLFAASYSCVSYFMTSQMFELSRFILFSLALSFNAVIGELLGLALGATNHKVNAIFNSSILMGVFILLGGFLVLLRDFPDNLYFMSYIGYFRYVFEVLVVSQYGYDRARLSCPKNVLYCHFRNPEMVVKGIMGMSEDNVVKDIGILCLYALIVGLLAFTRVRSRLKTYH